MAITEHDVELFAARIRVHFPPDQRDVAYEVKRLTPDTPLAEILGWWKTTEPIPTGSSGDSLEQVEWIMAMEEEFGPAFTLPGEFAGRLEQTTFRQLVEHVIRKRKEGRWLKP